MLNGIFFYVNSFEFNTDDFYRSTTNITTCGWLIKYHRGVYIFNLFDNLN